MTLEEVINERVSFLKEQISQQNKPLVNRAFEIQIRIIRNTDYEKVALHIRQKKKELEISGNVDAIEWLYTELDALEWLQKQVVKFI
jgi:hypothetical protein